MTSRTRIGWLLITLAVACCGACAHRVQGALAPWELRGAVVDAPGDRLRIRHKTGQMVEVVLDDRTVITHDGQQRDRDVLRRGARVRVRVVPQPDGALRADTVRVYGGARD